MAVSERGRRATGNFCPPQHLRFLTRLEKKKWSMSERRKTEYLSFRVGKQEVFKCQVLAWRGALLLNLYVVCASETKDAAGSESSRAQNTSDSSVLEENTAVTEEKLETTTLETPTDAETESDIARDAFNTHPIKVTDDQLRAPPRQRNASSLTSSANVITLAEVKRRMAQNKTHVEDFHPEVVESELQRLLTFFDRELKVKFVFSAGIIAGPQDFIAVGRVHDLSDFSGRC